MPIHPEYPELDRLWTKAAHSGDISDVENYLIDIWLDDYCEQTTGPQPHIVEVSLEGFSYLFDISHERLIAAWGISKGKNTEKRDKRRMRGHPLSAGRRYHRGHAIAHSLGGTLDINLVPQLGAINTGPFRHLENRAVSTPGAMYFTYWIYPKPGTQIPSRVHQALLRPGCDAETTPHPN